MLNYLLLQFYLSVVKEWEFLDNVYIRTGNYEVN